jgi:hypothetical protein
MYLKSVKGGVTKMYLKSIKGGVTKMFLKSIKGGVTKMYLFQQALLTVICSRDKT